VPDSSRPSTDSTSDQMPVMTLAERLQIHSLASLARIEQEVMKSKLSRDEAVFLAQALLSHGHPKAARPINLLKQKAQAPDAQSYARFQEQCYVRLREFFRFEELDRDRLDLFYQQDGPLYLRKNEKSSRLLVLFTTRFNNFYYSNAIMAALLSGLDCDLLFLRDSSYSSFWRGAKGIADDFTGIGDKILETARRNDIERIYLTAFSAAGYAALVTSLRIPCHGYLGFSQIVDGNMVLSQIPERYSGLIAQVDTQRLVDSKPLLEDADPAIPRALYYGALNSRDVAQARHVEGLPSIRTICMPDVGHATIRALLAADQLRQAFATLIDGRSDWPVPQAPDAASAELDISPVD
jgi:hypothetical protein